MKVSQGLSHQKTFTVLWECITRNNEESRAVFFVW